MWFLWYLYHANVLILKICWILLLRSLLPQHVDGHLQITVFANCDPSNWTTHVNFVGDRLRDANLTGTIIPCQCVDSFTFPCTNSVFGTAEFYLFLPNISCANDCLDKANCYLNSLNVTDGYIYGLVTETQCTEGECVKYTNESGKVNTTNCTHLPPSEKIGRSMESCASTIDVTTDKSIFAHTSVIGNELETATINPASLDGTSLKKETVSVSLSKSTTNTPVNFAPTSGTTENNIKNGTNNSTSVYITSLKIWTSPGTMLSSNNSPTNMSVYSTSASVITSDSNTSFESKTWFGAQNKSTVTTSASSVPDVKMQQADTSKNKASTATKAGAAVGGVAGFGLLLLLAGVVYHRLRKRAQVGDSSSFSDVEPIAQERSFDDEPPETY